MLSFIKRKFKEKKYYKCIFKEGKISGLVYKNLKIRNYLNFE